MRGDELRSQIGKLVREFYQVEFADQKFIPGESPVPVSGRVFDHEEIESLVQSGLDFWLTTGRFAAEFEREFCSYLGIRHSLLVNSGSSANLLALTCLTSPKLRDSALQPGDEVITVACGFPTTVNPILHNGLIPVFVDVDIPTYNIDATMLEEARSERTRAVMIAHTLGNPFDLSAVTSFCEKHDLYLIEDTCDALGSTYEGKLAGTFGDTATVSFYPAHHITMGEGGAVLTNRPALKKLIESYRDWGRDCWCEPGEDNTCGKRFGWQLGSLPEGYDHKYTYSHIGYNLKLTDMQAAVGVAQLKKLPSFIEHRKANFRDMTAALKEFESAFLLPQPTPNTDPSWFGYPIAVREEAPFSRNDVVRYLESRKIATRLLFGGNLTRQPAYEKAPYRVVGSLERSDFVMNNVFWIGIYPGLTAEMKSYVYETFAEGIRTNFSSQ